MLQPRGCVPFFSLTACRRSLEDLDLAVSTFSLTRLLYEALWIQYQGTLRDEYAHNYEIIHFVRPCHAVEMFTSEAHCVVSSAFLSCLTAPSIFIQSVRRRCRQLNIVEFTLLRLSLRVDSERNNSQPQRHNDPHKYWKFSLNLDLSSCFQSCWK